MILELDSERAGLTSAWLRKSERCGSSASWTPADTHVSTNVDRDRHHALLTQFSILGQHEVPSRSASGSKSEGEAGRVQTWLASLFSQNLLSNRYPVRTTSMNSREAWLVLRVMAKSASLGV